MHITELVISPGPERSRTEGRSVVDSAVDAGISVTAHIRPPIFIEVGELKRAVVCRATPSAVTAKIAEIGSPVRYRIERCPVVDSADDSVYITATHICNIVIVEVGELNGAIVG